MNSMFEILSNKDICVNSGGLIIHCPKLKLIINAVQEGREM